MDKREPEKSIDLSELSQGPAPPDELERRTIARLRNEGLVRSRKLFALSWRIAASIAAAFILGVTAGLVWDGEDHEANTIESSYMLVLYVDEEYDRTGDPRERVAEYDAWARATSASGPHVMAAKFTRDVWTAADGPADSNADSMTGFYLVDARSPREALELARQTPHVRYGGKIVVRKIDRDRSDHGLPAGDRS